MKKYLVIASVLSLAIVQSPAIAQTGNAPWGADFAQHLWAKNRLLITKSSLAELLPKSVPPGYTYSIEIRDAAGNVVSGDYGGSDSDIKRRLSEENFTLRRFQTTGILSKFMILLASSSPATTVAAAN